MATKKKKKPAPKKAAKKVAKKAVKKTTKKATKKVAKKAIKKIAKKAAKKVAKKAIKKTAKKSAKKVAKKAKSSSSSVANKEADGSSTAMIVQHVFLSASPAKVYRALTDPTEHSRFTGTICTGAALVGRTYVAGSGYIQGKYLELVPDRRIVSEWRTTEWPHNAPGSKVEIELTEAQQGDTAGTELVLTHTLVPISQAEDYRQGWIDSYWHPLRRHFGT
jgi:uncharacterized protein YndB with AHSA1/START domain